MLSQRFETGRASSASAARVHSSVVATAANSDCIVISTERWRASAEIAPVERVVLEQHEPARFEWTERSPAGVRRFYVCSLTPLDDGGYLFVGIDATTLKQSEERLRRSEELMVDTQGTAHLGTWEWDVSQPHATWSAELYRIYGLTPERLTLAKSDAIVMHPGPINRGVEIDSAVVDGRQSVILPQVTFGIAVRMAVMSIVAGNVREAA